MELLQFLFMFYLENTLLLTILVMINPEKTMKREQFNYLHAGNFLDAFMPSVFFYLAV